MSGVIALSVYGGLLAVLALGALLRPPSALAAVLCIYGLKQWGQSTNAFLAAHPPLTNIAVGVLVLCALVATAARGRCILCDIPKVTWAVLALLLYSLLSLLWTPRPDIAKPIWVDAYPYLATFVMLVPLVIHETEDLRVALNWLLVVGGALVLVLLIFGHWGLRGLSLGTSSLEQETNPLALAGLGGMVAAAAMLLRPRRISFLTWPLRLALVGAGLLLIVRSESRGQLVAVLAAMLVMLPFSAKFTSVRGVTAAIVGCVVVVVALNYAFSMFSAGHEDAQRWSQSTNTADAAVRFEMVGKLLSASSQSGGTVLFGLGNSASWDPDINGIYPHNVPMEVLGEEGVVGFLLYLAICVSALSALVRALLSSNERDRPVVAASGAGFLFFLLVSLKQGNMIGSVEFFMYAILLVRLSRAVTRAGHASDASVETQVPRPVFHNILR
ncbi:MAG: hypothetical protein JWO52_2087 [Gammaproteobacteria bacterium]|nr:hypothetical protein [Gammaproteobacteria bacterium]